jgi:hypothetical protein
MAANVSDIDTYRIRSNIAARSNAFPEHIEQVVNELNGICRTSSLEFALKVGAVIIHNFYDGDTNAWRDRGPKVHSFRRLAEHPDLLISPGALYRCVAVFELCDRLRAPSRWRRLGASHLRAVIGLPAEKQEALLTSANEQRWSVQLLNAKAQALREGRSRGGRRAQSPLVKNLRALEQRLRDCESALEQIDSTTSVDTEKSMQLLTDLGTSLEQVGRIVEAWRARLRDKRI